MNLSEFLATASKDDATALAEARAYQETVYSLTSSEAVALMLVQNGLYGPLYDESEKVDSPARGICMAFMDRVRAESSFNWADNTVKGQANRQMIDTLISLLPALEPNLTAFKAAADAESSETVQPFESANLHLVKVARGTCHTKPVTINGNYAVIQLSTDVPLHSPFMRGVSPRTGKLEQINVFNEVSLAGKYETVIPRQWQGVDLVVDDPYEAII